MNLLSRNEEPEAEVRRGKLQKAPATGEASCLDHCSQPEVDSVERMKTRTIDFCASHRVVLRLGGVEKEPEPYLGVQELNSALEVDRSW